MVAAPYRPTAELGLTPPLWCLQVEVVGASFGLMIELDKPLYKPGQVAPLPSLLDSFLCARPFETKLHGDKRAGSIRQVPSGAESTPARHLSKPAVSFLSLHGIHSHNKRSLQLLKPYLHRRLSAPPSALARH